MNSSPSLPTENVLTSFKITSNYDQFSLELDLQQKYEYFERKYQDLKVLKQKLMDVFSKPL